MPILNRNFTNLQLLAPGSQKLTGWGHAATENPQGSQQIFTQGQHFSGTAFELDGTDNQDPILGIIVVNPNLDAVTEAKVALQNYDAEFGKAVGSVVTAQTKSGSNEIHGSGFYFRRSDAQLARDPFTQSKQESPHGSLDSSRHVGCSSAAPSAVRSSRTSCSSLAIIRAHGRQMASAASSRCRRQSSDYMHRTQRTQRYNYLRSERVLTAASEVVGTVILRSGAPGILGCTRPNWIPKRSSAG